MNKFLTFVGLSAMILTSSACCEKKIYCRYGDIDFAFTGFPRNEVRNFTLRRYAKGDQWGKVLDSAQFIYYGSAQVTTRPDTLPFSDYETVGKLSRITQGNDWAVYLPSTNQTFYFTTIYDDNHVSELVRCNDNSASCTRQITYFSLNGGWQEGSFAYIQK